MITDTFPPIIIDADSCERLLVLETALCEASGSLLSQGLDLPELNGHLNALVLSNELLWAHEGDNPADECLHLCAEQLKCFHLSQIERLIA
jgi:hypothetical protein